CPTSVLVGARSRAGREPRSSNAGAAEGSAPRTQRAPWGGAPPRYRAPPVAPPRRGSSLSSRPWASGCRARRAGPRSPVRHLAPSSRRGRARPSLLSATSQERASGLQIEVTEVVVDLATELASNGVRDLVRIPAASLDGDRDVDAHRRAAAHVGRVDARGWQGRAREIPEAGARRGPVETVPRHRPAQVGLRHANSGRPDRTLSALDAECVPEDRVGAEVSEYRRRGMDAEQALELADECVADLLDRLARHAHEFADALGDAEHDGLADAHRELAEIDFLEPEHEVTDLLDHPVPGANGALDDGPSE